jgi:hypothetical protein
MSGGRGYLRRLSKPLRGGRGWPTADESIIADEDLDGSGIGLGLAGGPKCVRQLEFILVLVENSC